MSRLVSIANGNFTSSSTWGIADPTSLLDSELAGTGVPVTFTSSQVFTPGAITVSGLCVKLQNVQAAMAGTFSVRLFNSTGSAAVAGTTVTVNVSDLPNQTATVGGTWFYMKFASPVTLLAATNYTLQASCSTASQVTLYRDATASNWSRVLVTTNTQAPIAGDNLIVVGSLTAASTHSTVTVTLDTSLSTTYGQIDVNTYGTIQYPTTASVSTGLSVAGNIYVRCGNFFMGSVSTPIPSNSTAQLQFVCTGIAQFGMISNVPNLATGVQTSITMAGAVKTRSTTLSANSIAGATSVSTAVSTGWVTGDNFAIAPAGRTFSQMDFGTITANASGATLPIPAASFAHNSGNEIVNTSSNVQVFGTSNILPGSIYFAGNISAVIDNVEFYWLGSSTANKRGIDLSSTNTVFITNSGFHDYINIVPTPTNIGVGINVQAASTNFKLNGNVSFNMPYMIVLGTSITATTLAQVMNNVSIGGLQANTIQNSSSRCTFTGNIVTGCASSGMLIQDDQLLPYGDFSGNTSHGNNGTGIGVTFVNRSGSICQNLLSYFNNGNGIATTLTDSTVTNLTAYGNNGAGVNFGGTSNGIIQSATIYSTAAFAQTQGFSCGTFVYNSYIDSCTVGGASPLNHSTADINFSGSAHTNLVARNTILGSPNKVTGSTALSMGSYFGQAAINGVAGAHSYIKRYGTMTPDTVIFLNSPRSARITPNSATIKMQMPNQTFAIPSGRTANVSVSIRTSVIGDGAAYNGNAPRLMLKANPATGITSDTVLATFSGTAGAWTAVSGITPTVTDDSGATVYIDCDGTTGWINVPKLECKLMAAQNDPNEQYWLNGQPVNSTQNASAVPNQEQYWLNGQPVQYPSAASSNNSNMFLVF